MKLKHVYFELFVVLVLWVSLPAVYSSLDVDKGPIDRFFFLEQRSWKGFSTVCACWSSRQSWMCKQRMEFLWVGLNRRADFQRELVDLCVKMRAPRLTRMSVGCWYEPVLSHWVRCWAWLYIKCPGLPSSAAGWLIVLLFWEIGKNPALFRLHYFVIMRHYPFTSELNASLPNASEQGSHLCNDFLQKNPTQWLHSYQNQLNSRYFIFFLHVKYKFHMFNINLKWPGKKKKCPQFNGIVWEHGWDECSLAGRAFLGMWIQRSVIRSERTQWFPYLSRQISDSQFCRHKSFVMNL